MNQVFKIAAVFFYAAVQIPFAFAGIVYTNDFETAAGSEWSKTTTSTTPIGARSFLGEFGNEAVTLTLASIGLHDQVTVSFDLFILKSWDGTLPGANGNPPYAPDVFFLTVDGSTTLIEASFGNFDALGDLQSYPNAIAGGLVPHRTGASESNTLGYSWLGFQQDSVYNLSFTFPHISDSLALQFAATLQEAVTPITANESWGIDNVLISVNPVPEPSTFSIFGFAAIALLMPRRRLKH
ncbi:hypothetical protein Mal15_56830 [Stieleria maiorica]|uniref:PEP-CTERM protein-sorting domain-containing protein n=1 Tax=Stieleria maiorica TaxID=2795974 RepID=A0A5B9MPK0_9BACT|nr:PEP-CTERM sorting domain-containing protein [Stieleria maiorica]QEG01606.1 hypothetical protein Mal15_56830 [Stieleria maiorica]